METNRLTIAEFFTKYGVTSIDKYNTKPGAKIPFVLIANTPTGELSCIPSVKGYDQSQKTYVYPTVVPDVDIESGEVKGDKTLYVFSNNGGKVELGLADFK
jgi:hypothetical protein